MQALQIDHHGPVSALTVSDVPRPAFSPHEVLIEIEAAAINPSDVASAEGRFDQAFLPRILGHDFAGRVCEGPADLLGQDVWGSGGDLGIWRHGTHAEYLAIPRDGVALRPRALSVEEAAAVGVPFLTAWAVRRCSISWRRCSRQGPLHRRASRHGIRCHRWRRRTSASPAARSC